MAYFNRRGNLGVYGDGSDGDVIISTPTTLTRTMMYRDLTLTGAGVITVSGYPIFVQRRLIINTGTSINANGSPGLDSDLGGAAGAGASTNFFGGNAGAAGAGGVGNGVAGTSFVPLTFGNLGGNGGKGGEGGSTTGGLGGSGGPTPDPFGGIYCSYIYPYFHAPHTAATAVGVRYLGGVGGGGGGGDSASNPGGGGGGGAGVVAVFAKKIYGDGFFYALGGKGGNGQENCGAGGGGGGGFVLIVTDSEARSGDEFQIDVSGGLSGEEGGKGSTAGEPGLDGTYIVIRNRP